MARLQIATNEFQSMNSDIDNNKLPNGMYRYALNCRLVSRNGNAGAVENVEGNVEIPYDLPEGDNTVIGTAQDDTKQRLFYFVYNSNNFHSILLFSPVDNSITPVILTSVIPSTTTPNNILKFDKDHPITHARVIDKFLVWTDGINPQRQINIDKALANEYVQPMIEAQINLAKQPPHFPPSFTYIKDTNKVQNYIEKRVFQFAIRYIYADNEVTTLSPYSDVAWDYLATDNRQSPYNVIQLDYGKDLVGNDLPIKSNPAFRSLIKAVEIFVRGSDYVMDVNGLNEIRVNNADWKKVATVTDFVQKNYTFNFYNNSNYTLLASTEANKLYEAIPIRSNALELKDNRLFVANSLEDYDNVELDIALQVDFTDYGQSGNLENPDDYDNTITETEDINFDETFFNECNVTNTCSTTGSTFECYEEFTTPLLTYTTVVIANPAIGTITANISTENIIVFTDSPVPAVSQRSSLTFLIRLNGFVVASYTATTDQILPQVIPLTYTGSIPSASVVEIQAYARIGGSDVVFIGEEALTSCYEGRVAFEVTQTELILDYTSIEEPPAFNPRRGHLKRGGNYQFGIVYFDAQNRYSIANVQGKVVVNGITQADNKAQVQFPLLMETIEGYFPPTPPPPIPTATWKRGVPRVTWSIFHQPPIWATHYAWVRTMNQNQNAFLQWEVQQVLYVKQYKEIPEDTPTQKAGELDNAVLTTVLADATEVYLSFENIVFYKNVNSDSIVASWSPEPNDRLRLMFRGTFTNSITPIGYIYDWTTEANRYDVPIKGIRGNWLIIDASFVRNTNIAAGDIVEVYTPRLQQDTSILYETGEIFRIINPHTLNRRHGKGFGSPTIAQDQTATLPATGIFDSGDVYYRSREFIRKEIVPADLFVKAYPSYTQVGGTDKIIKSKLFIEEQRISDFFYSYATDKGRITVVNQDNAQRQRFTSIRFSNLYRAESKINGLSNFEPLNEKSLPIEYGAITALKIASNNQSEGNIMLALMETETVSMYIGNAVLKQQGGGQLTAIASDVIATTNTLAGSYGCQNPESVTDYNGYVYWLDARKGKVCRYATNGLYPISDYGQQKQLLDYARQMLKIPNLKDKRVFAGFDVYNEEMVLGFTHLYNEDTTEPRHTLAFSEPANSFPTYYSYQPEQFGKVGTSFVIFKEGKLYLQNQKTLVDDTEEPNDYNTFCGEYVESILKYVMNEANDKIFRTNIIKGTITEEGEFWFAAKFETNLKQLSTLLKDNYENAEPFPDLRYESAFYADLLKDETTPNVTDPIFNGDDLRGEVLIVTLKTEAKTLCLLRFSQIGFIPSLGS